jgi:hypothetical protein
MRCNEQRGGSGTRTRIFPIQELAGVGVGEILAAGRVIRLKIFKALRKRNEFSLLGEFFDKWAEV